MSTKVIIKSIEQVDAHTKRLRELNSNWKYYPMQVITTDVGVFIDHRAGSNSGHWTGVKYELGEYEFDSIVNNSSRAVTGVEYPVATDNLWLKPLPITKLQL